jgi:propionyl-CoA synthetase
MPAQADWHADARREPEAFWLAHARRIHWQIPPRRALDAEDAPALHWFPDGITNLCFNAVDRHLDTRAEQAALVWESSEVDARRTQTYAQLWAAVNACAGTLRALGVERGDRVLIYMPMVPEAIHTMLACARLGAVHSVVFGGFAAGSLAKRLRDAAPRLIVTADGGPRGGRLVRYKPLVDEARALAGMTDLAALVLRRGLDPDLPWQDGLDHDYAECTARFANLEIPCEWVPSSHPSYVLYTSGTTGLPKGIQRDTGGYAVALAASMECIYGAHPGETMLTTSDIGWVVGHSYIVYGPLLHGMTSVVYEGLPVRPDPGVWWRLVERYRAAVMFSSPTAMRVLKKLGAEHFRSADTSSLRTLFLAGEPLDAATHRWVADTLRCRVVDHYWQTESGWPMLSLAAGAEPAPVRLGSPGFPVYGYDLEIVDEDLAPVEPGVKGRLVARLPTPPGFMSTIWGDDERFRRAYFTRRDGEWLYLTGDYALRDADGYFFMLGRDDDVINVAGHRLGTREIEETLCALGGVAEAAVVGAQDPVKGQAVVAFVVPRDDAQRTDATRAQAFGDALKIGVDRALGPIARPAQVFLVPGLPKTRSGKIMRRALLALVEGSDPGDLSTLEDAGALEAARAAIRRPA